MTKEKCDCDVNAILAEHRKRPYWSNCTRWNETHWFLWCPQHRVYLLVEEEKTVSP